MEVDIAWRGEFSCITFPHHCTSCLGNKIEPNARGELGTIEIMEAREPNIKLSLPHVFTDSKYHNVSKMKLQQLSVILLENVDIR